MTDKVQKIRKELARLKEETSIGLSEQENGIEQGRMEILNALSIFLDSMREEPVSEDLEYAIEQSFIYHENRGDDCRMDEQMETTYRLGFETGANWRKEQMMVKAKGGTVQKDYQIILDDGTYIDLDPSMSLKPSLAVKEGERVKVIVIEETDV